MSQVGSKEDELYFFAISILSEWFKEGSGLRKTPLKNYTGGDHNSIGFEGITRLIINKAIEIYNLTDRVKINQTYIEDHTGTYDRQRMDQHIYIDNKLALVEEDRAFIDKPFYTMKRGVVKTFMELPHTKNILAEEPIFIFLSLGRVLNDCQRATAELIFGHGEVIREANLCGWGGRSKKENYFDRGPAEDEVRKYILALCEVFEKYD